MKCEKRIHEENNFLNLCQLLSVRIRAPTNKINMILLSEMVLVADVSEFLYLFSGLPPDHLFL